MIMYFKVEIFFLWQNKLKKTGKADNVIFGNLDLRNSRFDSKFFLKKLLIYYLVINI